MEHKRPRRPLDMSDYLPFIAGAISLVAATLTITLSFAGAKLAEAMHGAPPSAEVSAPAESATPAPTPEATPEPEAAQEPEATSRYEAVELAEEDIYTLACLVYHEARGEPFEGQAAVVEVVLNRCLSDAFPDTVEEVVFQKYGNVWQFSPAPYLYSAEPDKEQYLAVHTAIEEREHILSEDTVYFSTAPYNESVDMIIGNHYFCKIF